MTLHRWQDDQLITPRPTDRLVSAEQMRQIEAAGVQAGISYVQMMQTAGRAVGESVWRYLENLESARSVVCLIGPGNNGGDGLVAAAYLAHATKKNIEFPTAVTLILLKPREQDDPNWVALQPHNLSAILWNADDQAIVQQVRELTDQADAVIDALFGTGFKLPLRHEAASLLRTVKEAAPEHLQVYAVDLPSGIDADTGQAAPETIRATDTITFEAAKIGMVCPPAVDLVGYVQVVSLGLPNMLPERDSIQRFVMSPQVVREWIPDRESDSNKGTFGKALIAAGSGNYVGAAALSATAAYRIGAGLVAVATPQPNAHVLAPHLWETTWLPLPHEDGAIAANGADLIHDRMGLYSALLVGPGLGTADPTKAFIDRLLSVGDQGRDTMPPLVLDADALNILAGMPNWWERLPPDTILTPHPGEIGRLLGIPTAEVQSDRVGLAERSAREWNCVVILKGAYTVIAAPDGRTNISPFATSALAKAGTGDVLAGAIVGLRAQAVPAFEAASLAVYIHALAARLATLRESKRPEWSTTPTPFPTSAGFMSRELTDWLPTAIHVLQYAPSMITNEVDPFLLERWESDEGE